MYVCVCVGLIECFWASGGRVLFEYGIVFINVIRARGWISIYARNFAEFSVLKREYCRCCCGFKYRTVIKY